jgi:hypothetical protein
VTATGGGTATATAGSVPEGTVVTAASAAKTAVKPAVRKKPKLPLCPLKKPRPRYHIVKGKRVRVKLKPCRPRPASTKKVTR